MKQHFFALAIIATVVTLFAACKKDGDDPQPNQDIQTYQEFSVSQNISEDLDDEITLQLENFTSTDIKPRSLCPEITSSAPRGTFPNTITFDYGSGCTGKNGHFMKGKIVAWIDDSLLWVKNLTFVNFYIDGAKIDGSINTTRTNPTSGGFPCVTKVRNITVGYLDSTWVQSSNFTFCQVGGLYSPRVFIDDVFEITGNSSGTNRFGTTYSATIVEPLIKKRTCRYITEGRANVTRNGNSGSIDFGDGNCDRLATATLPNGTTRTILLDPWWR